MDGTGSQRDARLSQGRDGLATISDETLVERVQSGDTVAFEALMIRYRGVLTGFLYGKTPAIVDTEDLLQEIYIAVYRDIPSLRKRSCFGPWLIRIAKHKLHDAYREQGRRTREEAMPAPDTGEATSTPRDDTSAAQEEALVRDAIAGLPESYRLVLVLRLFEEHTLADIARLLDLRESTVRVRLHRGLERLRSTLRKRGLSDLDFG